METPNARPVRSAIGLGVSLAVAASGLTALVAPAANATVVHPAAATVVHASVVRSTAVRPAAAPANSVGQGPLTSSCRTVAGRTACDIWAKIGAVSVHDSASTTLSIPVWNFVSTSGAAATGASSLLIGTVGVPMDITLHNLLPQPVGFSTPQVDGALSDTTGVVQGSSKTYTITPQRSGSYIYQAGLTSNGARQVGMGLAGALVVRPAAASTTAYDVAQAAFDDEALMLYADVDANLAADPLGFNMRNYNPQFHLLNGVAYPDGAPIITDAGRQLMLRFVNISQLEKSPTILGIEMTAFARGARPMPSIMTEPGRLIAPGDTVDASILMPAGSHRYAIYDAPGLLNNGNWVNGVNSQAIGGGLTFIQSGGTGVAPPTGPSISRFSAAGQPGGLGRPLTMSAILDTANRGGGDIAQAEYYVDTLNATPGTGTTLSFSGASPLDVSWPLDVAGLSSGLHNVYLRAQDSFGSWGPVATLVVKVDATGPLVTGVVLSSPTTSGRADLGFTATANDTTTGGSNSIAARYWLDGTATPPVSPIALTTNGPRIIAAIDGIIPMATLAGLAQGRHTLYIQAQDSFRQWGVPTATVFGVDFTAPVTSAAVITPGATNGVSVCDLTGAGANPGPLLGNPCLTNPASPGTFTITADAIDPVVNGVNSAITKVEAYLMNCNPTCPALPPTGSTNSLQLSPAGAGVAAGSTHYTGQLPLSWFGAYRNTSITIKVVAIDAAGNRVDGGTSTKMVVDQLNPVVSTGGTITQGTWVPDNAPTSTAANYTNDGSALLSVPASDGTVGAAGVSGVAFAEYWIGADPGIGNGTRITLNVVNGRFEGTLDLNALGNVRGGSISVNVRVQDFANNWSPVAVVTGTLVPVTVFANDLEATVASPFGWTAVTGAPTRSTVTPIGGAASLLAAPADAAVTKTATGASGAVTVTLATAGGTSGVVVGQAVSGTGVSIGATVTAINTGTRVVTLSVSNYAAVSGTLTFRAVGFVSRTVPTTGTPALTTEFAAHFTMNTTSATAGTANPVTVLQGLAGTLSAYQVQYARSANVTTTATGTSGASTITVASVTNLVVNQSVTGTGIRAGAYITAINTVTRVVTLSGTNTGTVSGTMTFSLVSFRVNMATTTAAVTSGAWTTLTTGAAPTTGTYVVTVNYRQGGATGATRGQTVITVNGQTITTYSNTGTASSRRISSVRMGVIGNAGTTGVSMKFDTFSSARVAF